MWHSFSLPAVIILALCMHSAKYSCSDTTFLLFWLRICSRGITSGLMCSSSRCRLRFMPGMWAFWNRNHSQLVTIRYSRSLPSTLRSFPWASTVWLMCIAR